jgi:hypothetical protein
MDPMDSPSPEKRGLARETDQFLGQENVDLYIHSPCTFMA